MRVNLGLNSLRKFGRVITVSQQPVWPIAKETPLDRRRHSVHVMGDGRLVLGNG